MADSQSIAADLEKNIVDGGDPVKNKHARDLFQSIRDAHGEEAAQDMMNAVMVHNKKSENSVPEDKIKSFFSDVHDSDHVESIKSSVSDNYGDLDGPITFLNSYYNSESFHNRMNMEDFPFRHEEEYKNQMEYIKQGIDHYKPFVIQSGFPMIGSGAIHYPGHVGEIQSIQKQFRGMDDDKRPDEDISTILSMPQAKKLGTNLYREVIPHEYTHNTRGLTEKEEEDIIGLSKNPKESLDRYNKNKSLADQAYNLKNRGKDTSEKNPRYDISSDVFEMTDHDFSPNEKYADLNALRFMMHLQGIYDVRKGEDMKMEDLNKALRDKSIKDSFIMKRMLNNFTPENIVKFNNKIAFQGDKKKDDSTT